MRLDLIDETYLAVDRARVAQVVADPARWATWWPDLTLVVFMDRGVEGIRWSVLAPTPGSCEIWLEAVGAGVVVHHYLRLGELASSEPESAGGGRRRDRLRRQRAVAWKRWIWALETELLLGRDRI